MGNNIFSSMSKVNQIIGRNEGVQPVRSDESLRNSDTSNLSEHNELYTELLKAYVEDFKQNSLSKRESKQKLFESAKRLLFWLPVTIILFMLITIILIACDKVDVLEVLPEVFTALITLLGTFMVIPKMITKYLFNKEEEKYLAEIIGKIQKYDRNIRGGL